MSSNKIVVVGVSASGKSTFSRRLSEKLHIPVTHMDSIMWQPGWEYRGDDYVANQISAISQTEQWIIEGYIVSDARLDLFEKADQIIYLDYPGWLSAWRYLKRCWKYRKNPRAELPGSPEKFSFKFLKLVYCKSETWKLDKLFQKNNWNNKITRYTLPKQADTFLQNL